MRAIRSVCSFFRNAINVKQNGRLILNLFASDRLWFDLLYSIILILVSALPCWVASTTIDKPFTCNATSDRVSIVSREPLQGFVVSPNYPDSYPVDRRCTFTLEAPIDSGLVLHFAFIDLDLKERFSKSSQCLRDYIRFIMTDREGREHVGPRICGGDKLPAPIRGMQSKVEILLISSLATVRRRGFKIRFEFVPEVEIGAPPSVYGDMNTHWRRYCGGTIDVSAPSAEILSPGYPTTYPRDVTCNWLIRVEQHERVYVRLIHLELSPTVAECERAYLSIIDGYHYTLSESSPRKFGDDSNDGHAVKYCGGHLYYNEEGLKSYLSNSNRVVVRFVSRDFPTPEQFANYENNGTAIGFRLLWTKVVNSLIVDTVEVDASAAVAGSAVAQESAFESECVGGFLCKGGEFCIDNERNICTQRSRLCINATLQCNGVANCAENDNSDEYHCYSRDTVTLACAGLFVVVLTGTLLLIAARSLLRCGTHRRRLKNTRAHYAAAKADVPPIKTPPPPPPTCPAVPPISSDRAITPKSSLKSKHSGRSATVEIAVEPFRTTVVECADDMARKSAHSTTSKKDKNESTRLMGNTKPEASSGSAPNSAANNTLPECNCDNNALSRILADKTTIDVVERLVNGDLLSGTNFTTPSVINPANEIRSVAPLPPRRRFYCVANEMHIEQETCRRNEFIVSDVEEPPIWQLASDRQGEQTERQPQQHQDDDRQWHCRGRHRHSGRHATAAGQPPPAYQRQHSDGVALGRRSNSSLPLYLRFHSCDRNLIAGYVVGSEPATVDLDLDDELATVIQV